VSGDYEKFMALAIQEAEDGVKEGRLPYGGVIVKDGEVLGRGKSVGISLKDPTCHAEMMAIREAAKKMRSGDMRGCVLYANCDPCPMCAGAAIYSGVGTVVIGAGPEALRRFSNGRYDLGDYTIERLVGLTGMNVKVIRGVLEERAEAVFKDFGDWDLAAPPAPTA
jgi:tRNA(Arg) A34 adenosine deaminase TadA